MVNATGGHPSAPLARLPLPMHDLEVAVRRGKVTLLFDEMTTLENIAKKWEIADKYSPRTGFVFISCIGFFK